MEQVAFDWIASGKEGLGYVLFLVTLWRYGVLVDRLYSLLERNTQTMTELSTIIKQRKD